MSKILAVFGATGQLGGSVIRFVLADPELSKTYTIRALTRNPASAKADVLRQLGIEVVAADADDTASLRAALKGVDTVFSMTTPDVFRPDCVDAEYAQAKAIADAAVAEGVAFFVFNTLPAVADISGGKYHFLPDEGKARAEAYIRALPNLHSAFYAPGWFFENFSAMPWTPLTKDADGSGSWTLSGPISGDVKIGFVATVDDTGKYVGALLADSDRYAGKTIYGATGLYSFDEIAVAIGRATGKTVVYRPVPSHAAYEASLPSVLPNSVRRSFTDFFDSVAEYGYFGPDTEALIAWSVKQARGTLTTPDAFFAAHPPKAE